MVDFTLTDEQKDLRELAHSFAEKEMRPVAWEYDKDGTWPGDIIEKAWGVGLMNTHIEEAYGGPGLDYLSGCLIEEEFGWGCSGIGTSLAANGLASAPITLGVAALAAGWTGAGTNTVTGPSSSVSLLNLATNTGNDTITLTGLDDPFTIDGGGLALTILALWAERKQDPAEMAMLARQAAFIGERVFAPLVSVTARSPGSGPGRPFAGRRRTRRSPPRRPVRG